MTAIRQMGPRSVSTGWNAVDNRLLHRLTRYNYSK
jgi:hypothetical protein